MKIQEGTTSWLAGTVTALHVESEEKLTGASLFAFSRPLTGCAFLAGDAPATREFAALLPGSYVEKVHGCYFSGGSAFGLHACQALVDYQRGRARGFRASSSIVPVIPGACIYDLDVGLPEALTTEDVYAALQASAEEGIDDSVKGQRGAGRGATVGKFLGDFERSPGGVAFYSVECNEINVSVFVVVNALGSVLKNGEVVAGMREKGRLLTRDDICGAAAEFLSPNKTGRSSALTSDFSQFRSNTTLAAVFTNVQLDRCGLHRLSKSAASGFARSLFPSPHPLDGDVVFAFSTGEWNPPSCAAGHFVEMGLNVLVGHCIEKAIHRAVGA